MQAKLFKTKVLLGLMAAATALLPLAGAAQIAGPNIMARPAAGTRPIPISDPQQAAVWACTARYLYRNDPALQTIAPELLKTVQDYSVGYFERGLNAAVKIEMRLKQCLLKDSHVQTFKSKVFDPLQALPRPAPTLAADILVKLRDNHPERQPGGANATQFRAFEKELTQLGGTLPSAKPLVPSADAAPFTPAETADNPMGQATAEAPPAAPAPAPANFEDEVKAAPAASATLGWTALALALLSLIGVLYLIVKQSGPPARVVVPVAPTQPSASALAKAITFEEMKKYVQRELEKQQAAPAAATAAATSVAAAPVAVAPPAAPAPPVPGPRRRVQYVSEAPFNRAFLARALSEQPSAYSIFAIESTEQQPTQGTFTVTGNLASHVRDHRNVLEPVCDYAGSYPVGSETRIVTETPGQVRRRGDDWEVVRPAKVRFEA